MGCLRRNDGAKTTWPRNFNRVFVLAFGKNINKKYKKLKKNPKFADSGFRFPRPSVDLPERKRERCIWWASVDDRGAPVDFARLRFWVGCLVSDARLWRKNCIIIRCWWCCDTHENFHLWSVIVVSIELVDEGWTQRFYAHSLLFVVGTHPDKRIETANKTSEKSKPENPFG